MPTLPEQMRTPKSFWATMRGDGYSDWTFGFWRELFQNEVDAGAKRIDITVSDADAKGSFGRDPTVDKVVRVTFQGDGRGMDERVLREVFLRPGESTKKGGGYQGGFGTARVMLCFSQNRYSVRTQDWLVEGDGSEYSCRTVAEALAEKRQDLETALAEGADKRADQLRADMAALEASPGTFKGCRLEIDVDPAEFAERHRNVSATRLMDRLDEYLSMSQIPCKVYVNGVEREERTLKGPARRRLVATREDGSEVEFATVHTSQGERARFKGKLVVRADGAAMYTASASVRDQVVVEINPDMAREVLVQSRDDMKEPYRGAMWAFIRELTVDTKSALKDKDKRKHIKIEGGKGNLVARVRLTDTAPEGIVIAASQVDNRTVKARYTTPENYEVHGFGDAPRIAVDNLIEALSRREATFLPRLAGRDEQSRREIMAFSSAVEDGRGAAALSLLGEQTAAALASTLAARFEEGRQAQTRQLADMHDVHIQVDDISGNEKLEQALRRYKPNYWRRKGQSLEGRGMQAHMLLAAWTACCEEAVSTLLSLRPHLAKNGALNYSTGFYFGKSTKRYVGNGHFEDSRTGAQHQERDGVHILMVNPVTDAGQPAIDLTKARRSGGDDKILGIQDLEALACHEVAHMLEASHDEDYSSLLTDLMAMFNRTRAHDRMREAVDAVRSAYGKGQTLIQSMNEGETAAVLEAEEVPAAGRRRNPRPAEVVLAHAVPLTTIAAGVASAPENEHLDTPALRQIVTDSVQHGDDGVTRVDCDALQGLEADLSAAAAAEWDLDSLELPAAIELPELDLPATQAGGFDLGALDIGSASELPEMAQDSLDALAIPAADELPLLDVPEGMPADSGGFDLGGLEIGDISDLPALDAVQEAVPEGASSGAANAADRAAALVGEEFDIDDLDTPPGPSF